MCDETVDLYSGNAADIWALGVTLYALTYNTLPFDNENETELFRIIRQDELRFGQR